ncbi:MAG: hypothetical protein H6622_00830 [Halobacteriovoraceae bacterium]|nr:hypothetical protein [Halobacteriovoraceae bacterium]
MNIKVLFLMLSIFPFSSFSQDKEVPKEKTFTQNEVNELIEKEYAKRMKKIGRGKIIQFSNELLEKEKKIELQELEIKKREEQLKLNLTDLQNKIKSFQDKQASVLGCIDEKDKKVEGRIQHMVTIVSGMRPQNAADVLSVQDPDISVKILGLLDPVKVSKIFNVMDKEISARLQKQYMTMKR